MPLFRDTLLAHDVRLGLWLISENVDELPEPVNTDLSHIRSLSHRREVKAVYALLAAMMGRDDLTIEHDAAGQPLLHGWNLSISHTRGWAAIILSRHHGVGIDIEYRSDRVSRVADRFIRPDEQRDTLAEQLICWSTKETVYKLLSEENLQYFEMRLSPYLPSTAGSIEVDDLKQHQKVEVNYEINDNFVLTWATK
jgi:phosphopantetheinyl transferase